MNIEYYKAEVLLNLMCKVIHIVYLFGTTVYPCVGRNTASL